MEYSKGSVEHSCLPRAGLSVPDLPDAAAYECYFSSFPVETRRRYVDSFSFFGKMFACMGIHPDSEAYKGASRAIENDKVYVAEREVVHEAGRRAAYRRNRLIGALPPKSALLMVGLNRGCVTKVQLRDVRKHAE